VLLAAALVKLPWRHFLVANWPACLLWSTSYAAIGVLGGSVFPEPWQGIVAVIVLVLVVTQVASMIQKRVQTDTDSGSGSVEGVARSPSSSSQPTS
jgi:membrane protein DedA with SNARE-associated domain